MIQVENVSSQERQALEAAVSQIAADQAKVEATTADYENSMVSFSLTIGPEGANLQGWTTYTRHGEKIHFKNGKITSFHGLLASPGAVPLIGALRPGQVAGKTGTFKASGGVFGGTLQMWIDGQPVFSAPLSLIPGWPYEVRGEVHFSQPS